MIAANPFRLYLRPGHPDFLDLPWQHPLPLWHKYTDRVEELARGLSRHPVVFINYEGDLYAFKELPADIADREYNLLRQMADLRLPVVKPVGHARVQHPHGETSVLITNFLDYALPYRSLFVSSSLARYQEHLLDAMAGLLVQLHLAGIFWGDCSLSNTLFRRDAGTLQAYMVDAETSEIHTSLSPALRHEDLEIMEENLTGDLADLAASRQLPSGFPIFQTGASIRKRYQRLWEEITREDVLQPNERFRIQERIRALNALGYSVGEVELHALEKGDELRLRVFITDRNFHREQLHSLTGIEAEEMQARKMMNEIQELKATLSKENPNTHINVAAYHWFEKYYQPVLKKLMPIIEQHTADEPELYCQVLEHKWLLSEQAKRDVGHFAAVEDYLQRFQKQVADLTDVRLKPLQ